MRLRWSLMLPLALTACPGMIDDESKFKACQIDVEKEIFLPKCGSSSSCHVGAAAAGGLDLVDAGVRQRLKTGTSMCQGKPLVTFTAEKLGMTPACGSSMPLGAPLTDPEQKCVREYLAALQDGGT